MNLETTGRVFGTSATSPARLNLLNMEDLLLEVHSEVREIFRDLKIEQVKTKYSTSGTKTSAGRDARSQEVKEVLIMNY